MLSLLAQVDSLSLDSLLQRVGTLGGTSMLAIGFWLIYTGRLVTKREHDIVVAEKDEWKGVAMRSINNNEQLTQTTRKAVESSDKAVALTALQIGAKQ